MKVEEIVSEMVQVKIALTTAGLSLGALHKALWEPDDEYSVAFSTLPEPFARTYLRLRLRDFLYETFCLPYFQQQTALKILPIANDRLGGGLHAGLLEQFQQCNSGQGYFDAGWQIVGWEDDGTLAVEKYGVVLHVERSRHLSFEDQVFEDQSSQLQRDAASGIAPESDSAQYISIQLPAYRFEPGYYIAIGDYGPVTQTAIEIYFAASSAAISTLMATLTTALNRTLKLPYTLRAPYEPEAYQGPEAVALRVEKEALETIKPLLQRIRSQHTQAELRAENTVFGDSLHPGISAATVLDSSCTQWFGSSADLSRTELIAEVLVDDWYQQSTNSLQSNSPPSTSASVVSHILTHVLPGDLSPTSLQSL